MPTPTASEPNTCLIYCRVSSKEQVEGTSLENQERLCREYADRNGLAVLKVFVEMGESAKTADRTEFTKAIAFCTQKKGRVQHFIVYKIDRFARNQDDHVVVRSLLKRAGTELRSATETFDESAKGRVMEGMLSVFAEFDNNNRRERCKSGMQARVREGIWCWSAPLGYHRPVKGKKTNIMPEPDRAPLIRLGFELYAKGTYTFKALAQLLGDRGLRTREGKYPLQQTLEKIITNPVYCGRIKAFGEMAKGNFESIVDEALFAQCQNVKSGLHLKGKPRAFNNPAFPLRRFVVCQHCNHPPTTVIISNKHNKYPIYLIYSNSFKTKTYKYLIEVLQKITIPVACENGYSIKSNNLNSIVIFNNYIVTNKYEIIKLKSIEKLIKHAIDHNWRDIIIKHIYKLKLHKKHINTHTFDLCLYHTKLTTNIHVKLFDKNLFN
jgi:DNA invertase Pin-like site-specific DNA recombinase